jgi:DNA-binding IclR family transcriptional regulator
MREKIRIKILNALRGAKSPLTISELAQRARINRLTASDYVLKLQETGEIKVTPKPPLKLIELAGDL